MKKYIPLFLVLFSLITSKISFSQEKTNQGYSAILFKLKGDYPKDFRIIQSVYSNLLEMYLPFELNKINDSTYYTSFRNLNLSTYHFILDEQYFISNIESNSIDTIEFDFEDKTNFKVSYQGKYTDFFYNSKKFVEIIKNLVFNEAKDETWTSYTVDYENSDDLNGYLDEKIKRKNNYLETITQNPTMLTIGKEIIDFREIINAINEMENVPNNQQYEERIHLYQTIFKDRTQFLKFQYAGQYEVFNAILKDSLLNLPDISISGPWEFENKLESIFGNSLGNDFREFYERIIAVAYILKLKGENSLNPDHKLAILNYFKNDLYKNYILTKNELNSKAVNLSNVHYLPFDSKNEDVFENIVSKYKGKIVLIDNWATWCGPCIAGFEKIHPLKEKYKDIKDIVFLYLTDESSNYNIWQGYTKKLSGEHYFLYENQSNKIYDDHKINGIPHYMLLDKEGNIKYNETIVDSIETKIDSWIQSVL